MLGAFRAMLYDTVDMATLEGTLSNTENVRLVTATAVARVIPANLD